MPSQDHFWSRAADFYEKEFVDPYRPDVRHNPLPRVLRRLAAAGQKVVADLGCGIGPLLPTLADLFPQVYAVDFAPGMLTRAREAAAVRTNITFVLADLTDLSALPEPLDVAVAVNSLVLPDVAALDAALRQIHDRVKPGGWFLGILPAMDAVYYHTMLLLDRALASGKPLDAARKNAAHHADHADYDFAFGQFRFAGLEQHFWQPFEIPYRFRQAGFRLKRLRKVRLAWPQFTSDKELQKQPPPWDWFFLARRGDNAGRE
jgi:SAM-dependent methyltransferase